MRVVATGGIVGIGVVIAATMTSQNSKGWLIGLVVSIVSVLLARRALVLAAVVNARLPGCSRARPCRAGSSMR
jgi:hypothetical protein